MSGMLPASNGHDVEEPRGDFFRDQHGDVVVSRVAAALDIPIFDRADDVARVGRAEHQLDFVTPVELLVVQQQIEPPGSRLDFFRGDQFDLAQAEQRGIFFDSLLHPLFSEFGMLFERDAFRLDEA